MIGDSSLPGVSAPAAKSSTVEKYAGDNRMFEQTLAEFRAYYGEHKEDHTAPYAGTIEMLDRLRAAGVQLAVLTNKDHVSAAPLI